MKKQLISAACEQKELLSNMLELYFYEQSIYDQDIDPLDLNESGRYGFRKLEQYFGESGAAWLLFVERRPTGFVLLDKPSAENPNYEISEFFVIKKYRRIKLGLYMAGEMLKLYPNCMFIINTSMQNSAAQIFWRQVVHCYSENGKYQEYPIWDGRRMEWRFRSAAPN